MGLRQMLGFRPSQLGPQNEQGGRTRAAASASGHRTAQPAPQGRRGQPQRTGSRKPNPAPGADTHAPTVAKQPPTQPPPELPPALDDVCVVARLDDQTLRLFVMVSAKAKPELLTYIDRAKKAGFTVAKEEVDAEALAERRRRFKNAQEIRVDSATQGLALKMFSRAAAENASDIHIEIASHTDVMFRVNGGLDRRDQYPAEAGRRLFRALYQGYSDSADRTYSLNQFQASQITDGAVLPDTVEAVRLQRGPMHPDGAEFMVLRLLYRKTGAEVSARSGPRVGLEDGLHLFLRFGYTRDQSEVLARVSRQADGMAIFSGPTGSAKSSALKTALEFQHVLYPEKSIITIEDPPEYVIRGAKQLSVRNAAGDAGRKEQFAEALRVALRSDPDILMVGEIRDAATADVSLDSVITGHQMWTTLHAKEPLLIITRLIRFGLDPRDFLDPAILRALVGQRLLPTPCPACSTPFNEGRADLDPDIRHFVEQNVTEHGADLSEVRLRTRTPGCRMCHGTGRAGRRVVAEVISVDEELIDALDGGRGVRNARTVLSKRDDHMTMPKHALERMRAGEADPRDIVSVVGDLDGNS